MPNKRIRDSVHGLIVFWASEKRDMCAWKLINAPEFQRQRRIKQLGVSEFVFPGATHTRLAHSIGVFHTARELIEIIKREAGERLPEDHEHRADVAVLAALLHDIGHGPFSHTFEEVQKSRNEKKNHEFWTAEIIRNPKGGIRPILEEFQPGITGEIADCLLAETPKDFYGAVVSSSFDADRLDYLRRDRLMTGSGAGAIDFEWLKDNLRIADIDFANAGDEDGENIVETPFLCLNHKALQAAENFILARYHLYTQVYLHRVTRGVEQLIGGILRAVARAVDEGREAEVMLTADHPLTLFYRSDSIDLDAYLALDDAVLSAAFERMTKAGDPYVSDLASRFRDRKLFRPLDIESTVGPNLEDQRVAVRKIEEKFKDKISVSVFKDSANLSVYGEIGTDDAKMHKRIMILMPDGRRTEITQVSDTVSALNKSKHFVRYYFADDAAKQQACIIIGG